MRELSSLPSMLARTQRQSTCLRSGLTFLCAFRQLERWNARAAIMCHRIPVLDDPVSFIEPVRMARLAMAGTKRIEEIPVWPNAFVLRAPMRIDPVPAVALKFMAAFRTDFGARFRRTPFTAKARFGFHR
jgi:hypothetical protein